MSQSNGTNAHKYDPNFTNMVINASGPNVAPRTSQLYNGLVRHIHDFAREVDLTMDEWTDAIKFLNEAGKFWVESNGKQNEIRRLCNIIGLESVLTEIANHVTVETNDIPTSSAVVGPFWSANAPWRELGDSVIMSEHAGQVSYMHGTVTDLATRKPIKNVTFDFWQASSNGKYDLQDPDNQVANNLRGKFKTDENGEYRLYCLRPTPYTIPNNGPAGDILKALGRHSMRPAHIHLMISHDGYKPVATQIYPKDDPWLETDAVFAVKDDLVVEFVPLKSLPANMPPHKGPGGPAVKELELNIILAPMQMWGANNAEPIEHKV